eukprot:2574502-Pyramimonas_sp.AAC.1
MYLWQKRCERLQRPTPLNKEILPVLAGPREHGLYALGGGIIEPMLYQRGPGRWRYGRKKHAIAYKAPDRDEITRDMAHLGMNYNRQKSEWVQTNDPVVGGHTRAGAVRCSPYISMSITDAVTLSLVPCRPIPYCRGG